MAEPRPASAPTEHTSHDLLRVAEAADRGGRLPAELAACPDCTALHADLVALAAALPTVALPSRPRAYTLTPADAARLRPRGWRRWLGAIGSSRDVVTRPLAIGFTTLGLAGLLVATVPGALPGGGSTAGSAADTQRLEVAASEAPASAAPGDGTTGGGFAQTAPEAPLPAGPTADGTPLAVMSVGLLVAGGGLVALRRLAPRLGGRA